MLQQLLNDVSNQEPAAEIKSMHEENQQPIAQPKAASE
jgi:hypothetical protein